MAEEAARFAEESPAPDVSTLHDFVYKERSGNQERQDA
jgi:hypothetical protein